MEHDGFDIAGFGRGIIRRREALGWSSHRLAGKANLADPYVRKLETGQGVRLGVDVIIKLARALDVAPDELLADAGVETSKHLAGELDRVYRDLGRPERAALIRIGRTLREMQTEYEVRQAAETPASYVTGGTDPPGPDEEPLREPHPFEPKAADTGKNPIPGPPRDPDAK